MHENTSSERVKVINNVPYKEIIDLDFYPKGANGYIPNEAAVTPPSEDVYELKNYMLQITDAYALDHDRVRVRGSFKNTGFATTPETEITIKCYDKAGGVIGTKKLSLPPVDRFNTKTFQTEVLADSLELDYCLASI